MIATHFPDKQDLAQTSWSVLDIDFHVELLPLNIKVSQTATLRSFQVCLSPPIYDIIIIHHTYILPNMGDEVRSSVHYSGDLCRACLAIVLRSISWFVGRRSRSRRREARTVRLVHGKNRRDLPSVTTAMARKLDNLGCSGESWTWNRNGNLHETQSKHETPSKI